MVHLEHLGLAEVVPNCLVAFYDTHSESSGIFYYSGCVCVCVCMCVCVCVVCVYVCVCVCSVCVVCVCV